MQTLLNAIKNSRTDKEKIELLNQDERVKRCLERLPGLPVQCSEKAELIFKSLIAIGQEECLSLEASVDFEKIYGLLEDLFPIETFYKEMGGIIGYHATMLSLLNCERLDKKERYHPPPGIDITSETEEVSRYILEGIAALPFLAEIYPVGGAADRLNFCDPISGQPLPAAKLTYGGYTLLEGLIRDVQAREYLYFKLFGKQITTPIAMMTSLEKDNHRQILALCEEQSWFGRPKSAFRFFCQPLVPTMDKRGNWCLKEPFKLLMKPGGHGVIWKMAKEEGIFDWLQELGKKKVLVRQINNPIAGVDYGILAFCGVGFAQDKSFGFASCPRLAKSAEGMNILVERVSSAATTYCITNIEYCDFKKFGIEDTPTDSTRHYSQFPSNTNILFADIAKISQVVTHSPIPGMLVNLKKHSYVDAQGNSLEQEIARLESTMQNIADCFECCDSQNEGIEKLPLDTYVTYNHRRKTISATKKLYQPGASLVETPEGCFYDQLHNAYDLLRNYCNFLLPEIPNPESYIAEGPSFLFFYHPALGPLYRIIAQKICGGVIGNRSELRLEIAEALLVNLHLQGCLHVIAEQALGERDENGILRYSERVGRCRLKNVRIENGGYAHDSASLYWNRDVKRLGLCEILIHGNGEFVAENITLAGSLKIEVEAGMRVTAYEESGCLKLKKEPL